MGDPKIMAFLAFGAALVLRLGTPVGALPEVVRPNATTIAGSVKSPPSTYVSTPSYLLATPSVGLSGVVDNVQRHVIDENVTMPYVPSYASEAVTRPASVRKEPTSIMPQTSSSHPVAPARSRSTAAAATPTSTRSQALEGPRATPIPASRPTTPPVRPLSSRTSLLPLRPAPRHSVTSLVIPRIGIRTDVVLAPFVREGNDLTWAVPPFRVGYAQFTAGAGERGNTVLIGHVSSRDAGSVFHDLVLVRPGDEVRVSDGVSSYDYTVTETRVVSRTDVSVVQSTPTATITLITCTGAWLPWIDDYAARLVVRGVLTVSPRQPVLH